MATVEACLDRLRSDNNPIDVIEGLDTALVYINNLIDHPENPMYQRIRLSNINFMERIGHLKHALSLLKAVGFTADSKDDDFITVGEYAKSLQDFVIRMRQMRIAVLTAKKQVENEFLEVTRLPPDHRWLSVKDAGCFELQGRRPHMEDDYLLIDSFQNQESSGLFCCFDGHGGRGAVEFCISSFAINLERALSEPNSNRSISECIESAFLVTDSQMRRRSILESGATAAVCLVRCESTERVLYSANAGDARAVLVKASDRVGTSVRSARISTDHKPNSADETERVNKAGGFVMGGRVNGVLAVSRAFGDHHLKPSVSVEPYISRTVLENDDVAVIIACDGVWDVLSDQEAAEFVVKFIFEPEPGSAQRASKALAELAYDRGSQDNITAIVVIL